MNRCSRKNILAGVFAGVGLTALGAVMMGQSASQPVLQSDRQYFVTGEGGEVHLWVREGVNLRCVGHGECNTHEHDHKEGQGHAGEAPKK